MDGSVPVYSTVSFDCSFGSFRTEDCHLLATEIQEIREDNERSQEVLSCLQEEMEATGWYVLIRWLVIIISLTRA
jgi:hypothetical protein